MNNKLDILVTFDKNYIEPFKVMLKSLVIVDGDKNIHIHLIHDDHSQSYIGELTDYCESLDVEFHDYIVKDNTFEYSKTTDRYPISMYYRLLAWYLLPDNLDRVLYLDPDLIIINSIDELWEMDLGDNIFAAASHNDMFSINKNINKIRLNTDHSYFNSGVILMDLKKARHYIELNDLVETINKFDSSLIMPDQDIFNYLYGKHTLEIPDEIWNYDHRWYNLYFLESKGDWDLDWVMNNTCIIHFNGRNKPWLKGSYNYFTALYRQLMKLDLVK